MVSITKPTVGGSTGTWGTINNQALTDLESAVTGLENTPGFYSGTASARASDTHYSTGAHWYDTDTKWHWVGTATGWVPMPGSIVLKVRQVTSQNWTIDGAVLVTFDTEDFDRLAGFTAGSISAGVGTGGTTYTPGIAGWYELTGAISFSTSATGSRILRWRINTTVVNGGGAQYTPNSSAALTCPARTVSVLLSSTDTVSILATSGGVATTSAVSDYTQSTMQVKYLGPT